MLLVAAVFHVLLALALGLWGALGALAADEELGVARVSGCGWEGGIAREGGSAVASAADVRTGDGARELLALALETYGSVDGLLANAGILRDRMFVNMTDDEWDDVITGQLRATFTAVRTFAGHWRNEAKAGRQATASIVTVSSTSGLIGAAGQSNYGAAKAGIAAMSTILAGELERYAIRVNCLVPVARTRMTEDVPAFKEMLAAPTDPNAFDTYHPGNVSPLAAWLLSRSCPLTGRTFYAKGGEVREFLPWQYGRTFDKGARWTVAELDREMRKLA